MEITKVFEALSNEIRLKIIQVLYDEGELSYGELMERVGLPVSKSGKFGYHLSKLVSEKIVEIVKNTGKYKLSNYGMKIYELIRDFKEAYMSMRDEEILVYTSRHTLEYFDRNKIISSLVKETGLRKSLARDIAIYVEEKLKNANLRYVSTNLIRELVIAALFEKGYENYIKLYSRYGLPVYDVGEMFKKYDLEKPFSPNVLLKTLGESIIEAYMLSQLMPPSTLVAHLNGYIHLANSNRWFLGVEDIRHDLIPCFSKRENFMGLKNAPEVLICINRSLRDALFSIFLTVKNFQGFIFNSQTIENFNYLLAPFIHKLSKDNIINEFKYFVKLLNIDNLNYKFHVPTALSCAFSTPEEYENIKLRLGGLGNIYLSDYEEEAFITVKYLLEALSACKKESLVKSPVIILRINSKVLSDEDLLMHIYNALKARVPLIIKKDEKNVTVSAEGLALPKPEDVPVLPAYGVLSTIAVNLPLIAVESMSEDNFYDKLYELVDAIFVAFNTKNTFMSSISLERRYKPLTEYIFDDMHYFQWENSYYTISLTGVFFTAKIISGSKDTHEMLNLAQKIAVNCIKIFRESASRESYNIEFSFMCGDRNYVRVLSILERALKGKASEMKLFFSPLYLVPPSIAESLEHYIKLHEFNGFKELRGVINVKVDPVCFSFEDFKRAVKLALKYTRPLSFSLDYTYCNKCKTILDGFHHMCPHCLSIIPREARFSKVFTVYEQITAIPEFYITEYLSRKNIYFSS
ncbi:MAG: hypothetical protein DRJ98_04840 [Thermoprotei archaeon]|nr:MAG: hypothetical protein DRJ52_03305 [Thermoprotei archaeon]RLF10954.1 MAG: hypothetical protein DRJ98_04840 [Thermoprotei archaeon]